MTKRLFFIAAPLFTATAAFAVVALAAQASYSFKIKVEEGYVQKSKVTLKSDVGGMGVELGYLSDEKILKVEADGTYTEEVKTYEPSVLAGGAPVPQYGNTDRLETKKLSPIGQLLETSDKATPFSLLSRASRMSSFPPPPAPVKVGESWTYEFPAKDKLVAAKVTYKFLAEEKVGKFDALKLEFEFAEAEGTKPIKAKGFLWVSKTNFRGVKGEALAENFPAPPGSPVQTMNVKATFERIQ
ncbi:MAG: hypothetical protein ACOYON_06295 [Fimbriimonas sp.]